MKYLSTAVVALFLLAPIFASADSCPEINRSLSYGSRGSSVSSLQSFLISHTYLSGDSATGFFGRATESALKKLQCDNAITCTGTSRTTGWGATGPRTRALINSLCTKTTTISPIPPQQTRPAIHLLSPAGGEEFVSGGNITIHWNTENLPLDLAQRHPYILFSFSDYDWNGNYGEYTKANNQDNTIVIGNKYGEQITDVSVIQSGTVTLPIKLMHSAPNKFARQFLRMQLGYARDEAAQQSAFAVLATSPMNPLVELYSSSQKEITVAFPSSSSDQPCFDDYQNGGTWFANGQRRSSLCIVGGTGSGTVEPNCTRPNICRNGTWMSEQ